MAQLAKCSHGNLETLGLSPGRVANFSSPLTFEGFCSNSFIADIMIWFSKFNVRLKSRLQRNILEFLREICLYINTNCKTEFPVHFRIIINKKLNYFRIIICLRKSEVSVERVSF